MNFDESGKKTISELALPLKTAIARYWRLSWPPAAAVAILVTVLCLRLPDYFAAEVVIFIQPQKISSKIVAAPEKEEQQERYEALVQELLSKPRLRKIVDTYDPYPDLQGIIGKEKAMMKLRDNIEIAAVISPGGRPLEQTFRLTFPHWNAKLAYEVTNSLSNLFIEESIISQRSETQGTEEFLEAQLRDARLRLKATEKRVQEFVKRNAGKLPTHREEAMARLENAQNQLATNSQLIQSNNARLEFLERELRLTSREMSSSARSISSDGESADDPATSLAQLEQALVVLKSRYSDRHPDVIRTTERIRALRGKVKSGGGGGRTDSGIGGTGNSIEVRNLRREIGEVQVKLEALQSENTRLKAMADELDADIKSMPLKQQELTEISRDYENDKANYERLLAAVKDAELQSSLVRSQKSSQFKIVEPPQVPIVPAGPNRILIACIGAAFSLLVFILLPISLYFLNGSFKFREEAELELGIPVVGIIPPMKTPAVAMLARRASFASVFASVLSVCGGTLLILLVV